MISLWNLSEIFVVLSTRFQSGVHHAGNIDVHRIWSQYFLALNRTVFFPMLTIIGLGMGVLKRKENKYNLT
jgi:hypothetical protein